MAFLPPIISQDVPFSTYHHRKQYPPSSSGETPTNPYQQVTSASDPGDSSPSPRPLILALHQPEHGGQNVELKTPWWLWLLGFIDLGKSIIYAVSTGFTIVEKGVPPETDREKLMFIFFMNFVFYMVEFLMGASLIFALCSSNESVITFTLQGWLYGAYFLLAENVYFILSNTIKLISTKDEKMVAYVIANFTGILLRTIAIVMVRKYMNKVKALGMRNQMRDQQVPLHLQEQWLPTASAMRDDDGLFYFGPGVGDVML